MRAAALSLLALAGCGDQLREEPDAGLDATSPAVVALHYLVDPPETAVGWPVYFQDADGSLVSAQRTNGDGRANAFLAPGGSVTLAVGPAGSQRLWTYRAVEPGDELVLDLRGPPSVVETVTIDLRLPPAAAAASYQLFTTCGQAGLSALGSTLVMLPKCGRLTDMTVLARGGNGTIVGGLLALDVPLHRPAVVTLGGAFTAPVLSTVTVTNIPPTVASMIAAHGTLGSHELLYTQRLQFALPAPSLTFTLPQGRTGTIIEPSFSSGSSELRAVDWRDATEHAVFDLGLRLPGHDGEPPPAYTPLDRTLRWTELPGTVAPDLVIAGLVFSDGGSFVEWHVVAPRGAEPAITLPVIPDRRLEPAGTAAPFYLLDAVVEGGYAAGRERVLGRILQRHWPMEGPSGHATYQVTGFATP